MEGVTLSGWFNVLGKRKLGQGENRKEEKNFQPFHYPGKQFQKGLDHTTRYTGTYQAVCTLRTRDAGHVNPALNPSYPGRRAGVNLPAV